MMDYFLGKRFDLSPLAEQFRQKRGEDFSVKFDVVDGHFTPPDIHSAYIVVEFMLNLFTITNPLSRGELEEYISNKLRWSYREGIVFPVTKTFCKFKERDKFFEGEHRFLSRMLPSLFYS